MATPQHKMEKFLTTVSQRENCVWDEISFRNFEIVLYSADRKCRVELDLEQYPCDMRKDLIQKLKLADIASLPITCISIQDEDYEECLNDGDELPEWRTAIYEDIAEVILAFQSLPTSECTNLVVDAESHKGQATVYTLTKAAASASHHNHPNDSARPKKILFRGLLPPQKLKAACNLIVAPGSIVKSVELRSYVYGGTWGHTVFGIFLEEMLSIQKDGSYQALESLEFNVFLNWDDSSVKHLGDFLQCTVSVKEICFVGSLREATDEGWLNEKVAEILCLNNHVHTLRFEGRCLNLEEAVLRVLIPDSPKHQPITALEHLHLCLHGDDKSRIVSRLCGEAIKVVECLKSLQIKFCEHLDLETIEALKSNRGLEHFTCDIHRCKVDEKELFSTVMDVLRVNYQLKEFVYRWQNKYYEEALTKLFEERATNKPWEVMKDMTLVPSTSARLFFCGYPYAGKTTLKNTIIKSLKGRGKTPRSVTSNPEKISHYDIANASMSSSSETDVKDTYTRTRGIEVEATTLDNLHLTMWDMGGHDAYHPLHDLVISNIDGSGSSCYFLLVCNLFLLGTSYKQKKYNDVVNEIKYWLQFIASNTKMSILYHPYVKLIFTNLDKIKSSTKTVKNEVERHLKPLREQFKDTLYITEQSSYVNAHDIEDICNIVEELKATLSILLPTLPHVFEACKELQKILHEYKKLNPTHPLLKWEKFQGLCSKVSSLVVDDKINHEVATKRREIITTSLHEAGEVIFYKDLNFVIINPHWFCHDVIGQIIACKDCGVLQPEMGLLPSTSLMCFLEDYGPQEFDEDVNRDLLKLMMKLDLCFEQLNDNILIPASLFDDENNPSDSGARQLSWPTKKVFKGGAYVGRRVAPINTNLTMLTLGFFPRLQVSFQRIFEKNEYILKKNMISFICDEMEIILEYSGHVGCHIDIFVRSQNSNTREIYEFLSTCIVRHIFQECADPIRGCSGVILEESIIRPSCVKDLVLCKYRLKQAISVQKLKDDIKEKNSLSSTHLWTHEGDILSSDYDKAMSLMSDKEQNDVLELFSKYILAAKQSLMNRPKHETHVTRFYAKNYEGLKMRTHKIENMLMKASKATKVLAIEQYERQRKDILTLVKSKFDDLILLVQSKFHDFSIQSNVSISNLSNKLHESLTFSADLEKTRYPKYVWFQCLKPQKTKQTKRVFHNLLGTRYMVHLQCETLIGQHMHKVENQKGTLIKVENESSVGFRKILTCTLITLSTLISIGAHVVAPGIGALVPDVAKGFLLILDSPGLLDRGFNSIIPSASNQSETILHANKEEAKKWLRDLLDNKDIENDFGLYKVRYKNCEECINGRVAWICQECKVTQESQEKIDFLGCKL